MNIKTCFDTLGIPRDASLEDAKQSYKQLVKQWHPDQYGNDPEKQKIAHKKLTEINVAYREIVALLKNVPPSVRTGAEPKTAAKRHSSTARKSIKKASFFHRMASMFKSQAKVSNAGPRQTSESGHHGLQQGQGVYPGSVFRQELKQAIRRHPGGHAMGPSSGGQEKRERRRHVGRASGGGTMYRMHTTARRNRGDRVEKIEKIRPVRRVGKIGE